MSACRSASRTAATPRGCDDDVRPCADVACGAAVRLDLRRDHRDHHQGRRRGHQDHPDHRRRDADRSHRHRHRGAGRRSRLLHHRDHHQERRACAVHRPAACSDHSAGRRSDHLVAASRRGRPCRAGAEWVCRSSTTSAARCPRSLRREEAWPRRRWAWRARPAASPDSVPAVCAAPEPLQEWGAPLRVAGRARRGRGRALAVQRPAGAAEATDVPTACRSNESPCAAAGWAPGPGLARRARPPRARARARALALPLRRRAFRPARVSEPRARPRPGPRRPGRARAQVAARALVRQRPRARAWRVWPQRRARARPPAQAPHQRGRPSSWRGPSWPVSSSVPRAVPRAECRAGRPFVALGRPAPLGRWRSGSSPRCRAVHKGREAPCW